MQSFIHSTTSPVGLPCASCCARSWGDRSGQNTAPALKDVPILLGRQTLKKETNMWPQTSMNVPRGNAGAARMKGINYARGGEQAGWASLRKWHFTGARDGAGVSRERRGKVFQAKGTACGRPEAWGILRRRGSVSQRPLREEARLRTGF